MKRPPATSICRHCGQEFVKRDRSRGHRYCSIPCSNSGRSQKTPRLAVPDPDDAGRDTADYPGTEWGPLPPTLLIRVAAHILAAEYAAWAVQQKGTNQP